MGRWAFMTYIELCSKNGIIFNSRKFHIGQDEIDFAGFTITSTAIQQWRHLLDAILNFPTPRNTIDLRSWFGLVQQVAYATLVFLALQPFRDLLKPSSPGTGTTLDRIFESSKREHVQAAEEGVGALS